MSTRPLLDGSQLPRLAYGTVLLVRPGVLAPGRHLRPAGRRLLRLLGVRHVLQAILVSPWSWPTTLRASSGGSSWLTSPPPSRRARTVALAVDGLHLATVAAAITRQSMIPATSDAAMSPPQQATHCRPSRQP